MDSPVWNIRGGRLSAPFYIWGIVNATPDSFHDAGLYTDSEEIIAHARKLWLEGASILDIGGASSRPGAQDIPPAEEFLRIAPVIDALNFFSVQDVWEKDEKKVGMRERASNFFISEKPLISIDTWRQDVAQKALESGVHIINDISAFSWEPGLLDVVCQFQPGYVLMHCQGRPQDMQQNPLYGNVVEDVLSFFEQKMTKLIQAGLAEENIILDPGIGFGKSLDQNLDILSHTERLQSLGRPLLLGISHKSLFGKLLGLEPDERCMATQICTALMAQKGYTHHRVHDVKKTCQTLDFVATLLNK